MDCSLLAIRTLACDANDGGLCAMTEDEFWSRADAAQASAYGCNDVSGGGTFSNYYLSKCARDAFDACEASQCLDGWEKQAESCQGPAISDDHCYESYGSWGCAGEP